MASVGSRLRLAAAAAKKNSAADAPPTTTAFAKLNAADENGDGEGSQRSIVSQSQQPSNSLLLAVAALKSPSSTKQISPKAKGNNNKLRSAALAIKLTNRAATRWGDFACLESTDITSLSNEKLKRHLYARDELAEGTKQELIERLRNSLEEERQKKIAIELELEAKHRKIADAEEKGAVYSTGKNHCGQLGLGDLEERHEFTVIPSIRGKACHVSTGGNTVLATTDKHEVYAWGGSGFGPTGLKSNQKSTYKSPNLVDSLNGEEIIITSLGANHSCGASKEADLFVWGLNVVETQGSKTAQTPQPVYVEAITASSVSCGEMHTCVKTKEDEVYTFGHNANGRLGCGKFDNYHQPIPSLVKLPTTETVRLIACGTEHTLIATLNSIYSFGCGDGGKLGHGADCSDKYEPCEISSLRGCHVLSISAGTWHTAAVVHVPPLEDSGWLYTWGSGFQGQLAQDKVCKATTPTIVQDFIDQGISVRQVFCGSHHNAAIVHDGSLYTWGSNKHGALGRRTEGGSSQVPFTPHPGIVPEFGEIVNRIGRGLPFR